MRTRPTKERAESRLLNRYHKLYQPLIELVDSLQDIEPGGTLVDDVTFTDDEANHKVSIAYAARPIMLTIKEGNRTFILKMIELKDGATKAP